MSALARHREALLAVALLVLVVLVTLRFPSFARPENLAGVLTDTSVLIILAIGQMTVILTRAIDLSVAANLAFSGMSVALLNAAYPDIPVGLLILVAMSIGTVLGLANGVLVGALSIPPIVVTLGTLTVYRGLAFIVSGGAWVNAHEMTENFVALPRLVVLGLPLLAWTAIAIALLMAVVLSFTALGRAFKAVGGNPVAATYVGLSVGRTRLAAYAIAGLFAGLSGYLWVSRYAVAYVDIALGFELDVIAACVIGGVSIAGGIGSVAGAVLGALFLGVIKNALPIVNVSPFWQMAISGSVIILAVALNARAERRKGRLILKSAVPAAVAP